MSMFGSAAPPVPSAQPESDTRWDLTPYYNTSLSPTDENQFQQWLIQTGRQTDLADYDLRGAWKDGAQQAANGHFTDKFKKPNHPTFSNESVYSGRQGFFGGAWARGAGKGWTFTPSQTNLQMQTPQQLRSYFQRVEPDSTLLMR